MKQTDNQELQTTPDAVFKARESDRKRQDSAKRVMIVITLIVILIVFKWRYIFPGGIRMSAGLVTTLLTVYGMSMMILMIPASFTFAHSNLLMDESGMYFMPYAEGDCLFIPWCNAANFHSVEGIDSHYGGGSSDSFYFDVKNLTLDMYRWYFSSISSASFRDDSGFSYTLDVKAGIFRRTQYPWIEGSPVLEYCCIENKWLTIHARFGNNAEAAQSYKDRYDLIHDKQMSVTS
ncbi:MAG: hypothetical protein HOP02_13440 [Methylococcaceae bacterium]|nr:hypothetical protein [Methylococcaceae bacterium]